MKTKPLPLIGLACCVTSLVLAQPLHAGESPRAASLRPLQSSGVFGTSVLETCHLLIPGGGTALQRPEVFCTTNSLPTTIIVRRATGRYVTTIQTDEQGRFHTPLTPGRYILTPAVHITPLTPDQARVIAAVNPGIPTEGLKTYADPVRVVVSRGRFKPVTIIYRRGLPFTFP